MLKEIKKDLQKDIQKIEEFLKKHKKKMTIGVAVYLLYKWLMKEE